MYITKKERFVNLEPRTNGQGGLEGKAGSRAPEGGGHPRLFLKNWHKPVGKVNRGGCQCPSCKLSGVF